MSALYPPDGEPLSEVQKGLLLVTLLSSRLDDSGWTDFIPIKELAETCYTDVRDVERRLKDWRERGFADVRRDGGRIQARLLLGKVVAQ